MLLSFAFLFALLPGFTHAAGFTMAECESAVAEMNADLPMDLDDITTWTQTSCRDTGNDTLQLVYDNQVKDGSAITQENLDTVLPTLIMSWCFGPTLGSLMQMVNTIHYDYHFENGDVIGALDFSFADCLAKP